MTNMKLYSDSKIGNNIRYGFPVVKNDNYLNNQLKFSLNSNIQCFPIQSS